MSRHVARGQRRAPPAPQRERDDAADVGAQRDERREPGLGDPVDRQRRAVRADVGNDGERVDDIAERRRPDDEHAARRSSIAAHAGGGRGVSRAGSARMRKRRKPRKIAAHRHSKDPSTPWRARRYAAIRHAHGRAASRFAGGDHARCRGRHRRVPRVGAVRADALVVDSGSGDDTVEIARRCGARVVSQRVGRASGRRSSSPCSAARTTGCCASTPTSACRRRSRASIRALFARGAPRASGVRAGAAQPLPRPLARARRGLSRLDVRLFDRRRARWCDDRGARAAWSPTAPSARLDGDLLHASAESIDALHRQAEPLHDAAGGRAACARRARARRCAMARVAARALPPLLRAEARLSRRRRRLRAHRDRRVRELPQVREAARARARRAQSADARARRPARARHRCGRLHRHARAARAARRAAPTSSASTTSIRTTTCAEGGAHRDARGTAALRVSRASISPTRAACEALFASRPFTHVVHLAAQPGVRYSLVNPDAYVRNNVVAFGHVLEGCRHGEDRAPRLRVVVVGVRRQPRAAVLGGPERRPSGQPLRGDQEGERADGAQLQPPVRPADDRPALLHRLRSVGPARPGADAVHEGDPRRPADRRVQRRRHGSATSRTSTTSSKASCACSSAAGAGRRQRRAVCDLQHRQPRGRRARRRSSRRSSGCSAGARCATTGRCSPATCRRRTRRSTGCARDRLRAAHAARRRARALRRVVSRLLRGDVKAASAVAAASRRAARDAKLAAALPRSSS